MPAEVFIGVSSEGVTFMNAERKILREYGFSEIWQWGGNSRKFQIQIVHDGSPVQISLTTTHSRSLSNLIFEYIEAVMLAMKTD